MASKIFLALFAPACVFVTIMWAAGPEIDANWWALLLLTHLGATLHYVAGLWWCSYYLRYFFLAALAAAAYHSAHLAGLIFSLSVLAFAIGVARFVLRQRPRSEAIELLFPLAEGRCCIGQGGAYAFLNRHARSQSQRYALDLVQLQGWGNRARGLYPINCNHYAVFGSPVVSPCDGTVTRAVDGLPDLAPPDRDAQNVAGNHVVIREEKSGVIVGLAHLRCGSVLVKSGQKVLAGEPIGCAGNSGSTSEPHLHIHAKRGGRDDSMLDGEGVPMLFGRRFLVRNDLVRPARRKPARDVQSHSS